MTDIAPISEENKQEVIDVINEFVGDLKQYNGLFVMGADRVKVDVADLYEPITAYEKFAGGSVFGRNHKYSPEGMEDALRLYNALSNSDSRKLSDADKAIIAGLYEQGIAQEFLGAMEDLARNDYLEIRQEVAIEESQKIVDEYNEHFTEESKGYTNAGSIIDALENDPRIDEDMKISEIIERGYLKELNKSHYAIQGEYSQSIQWLRNEAGLGRTLEEAKENNIDLEYDQQVYLEALAIETGVLQRPQELAEENLETTPDEPARRTTSEQDIAAPQVAKYIYNQGVQDFQAAYNECMENCGKSDFQIKVDGKLGPETLRSMTEAGCIDCFEDGLAGVMGQEQAETLVSQMQAASAAGEHEVFQQYADQINQAFSSVDQQVYAGLSNYEARNLAAVMPDGADVAQDGSGNLGTYDLTVTDASGHTRSS